MNYITIDIWHIIEGDWVHLTQQQYHNKVIMYVNGKPSGEAIYANERISKGD